MFYQIFTLVISIPLQRDLILVTIMTKYKLKTGKVENAVVGTYKKIENGVVEGYQAIEDAVVGTYKKVEDKFVERFLEECKES